MGPYRLLFYQKAIPRKLRKSVSPCNLLAFDREVMLKIPCPKTARISMDANGHASTAASTVVVYPSTPWSQIVQVGESDPAMAQAALERLCERYRPAIVGYFRVKLGNTNPSEDAEDLAQTFFVTRWIEKNFLQGVHRERAPRFRRYLATCLASFFKDWIRHRLTQKNNRGGDALPIAHPGIADGVDVAAPDSSDQAAIDEAIALRIHCVARQQLERESESPERLSRLGRFILAVPGSGDYARAADELKLSLANVKQIVRRWRSRYTEVFHKEVALLVENRSEALADDSEYLLGLVLRAAERGEQLW